MKSGILHFILLVPFVLALSSCASTRYVVKDNITMVGDAMLIEPVAHISYLDAKNKSFHDDSLSYECASLLLSAARVAGMPISGILYLDGVENADACVEEISSMQNVSLRKKDIFVIPENLDKLLESQGRRFGVVMLGGGFGRDNKGYFKDAAFGLLLGVMTAILTAGTVYSYAVPERNHLQTWIAVLDSETDRVVYFDTIGQEAAPNNPVQVQRQVNTLADRFNRAQSRAR